MHRTALRPSQSALRAIRSTTSPSALVSSGARRFASTTSAPKKKSTWKGAAVRWGLAIAAVYYYNTSPIFSDELPETAGTAPSQLTDADLPTVDAIVEEKRRQAAEHAAARKAAQAAAKAAATPATPSESVEEQITKAEAEAEAVPEGDSKPKSESAEGVIPEAGASPEALQEEADAQGAFNPETGEINWDCPCLGGMAHGPCGEEFKAAFSCFVYSTEEPKGMDCIEKFSHMQDCFRKYPEVYGAELADDEEAERASAAAPAAEGTPAEEEPVENKKEEALEHATHDVTAANDNKKQQ
ncbi:mitochondrial intermembrane space protein Mia40 [Neurospora intermedia]|uniref:Mitochondrial intermembrane space import and assembly protein 40 n=1 Tax=Neurospora intermedia TaxID=5142 RepID=A0ABR3D282_NEUIN